MGLAADEAIDEGAIAHVGDQTGLVAITLGPRHREAIAIDDAGIDRDRVAAGRQLFAHPHRHPPRLLLTDRDSSVSGRTLRLASRGCLPSWTGAWPIRTEGCM
ncbi:MAG: hypothetical protein OXT09_07995, partial [Myxococcales bacterium]|nr:hypothetical protein [Myxococcales bacterium]